MKAVVYSAYGGPEVLQCVDVPVPVPAEGQVLLKVHAASINAMDWRIMSGEPFVLRLMLGMSRPKRGPGVDAAGVVEAVGPNVTRFKPGDRVFGLCKSAFAEYGCASENKLALVPPGVTFKQAACLPVAGLTALLGLRDCGKLQAGESVLINGASGGVGTFAVQIAKALGGVVTAVCSAHNAEAARSLGADHVIVYTEEDFTQGSQRYDLILDVAASHSPKAYRRVMKPNGRCAIAGAPKSMSAMMKHIMTAMMLSRTGTQKFSIVFAKATPENLAALADLVTSGKVAPMIDRRYALADVPEAMRYAYEGHARGKIAITVAT